jgi:predicted nucleic acid-binding Zn ribbon protein
VKPVKCCKICGKETPSRRECYCSNECRRAKERNRYYNNHEKYLNMKFSALNAERNIHRYAVIHIQSIVLINAASGA